MLRHTVWFCFCFGSALLISAQTGTTSPPRMSGNNGEDRVAQMIEGLRSKSGLPPLKRQQPSKEEVQLVCTAAATGKSVHEPMSGALHIYFVHDMSEQPEALKVIALGSSLDPRSGTRYPVYADKDWGRFSVAVFAVHLGRDDSRMYAIGIARHASPAKELLAPMTFDHPLSDSEDWKKLIATECRNERP